MKVFPVSYRYLVLALALAGCATAPPDRVHQPSPDFARAQHAASIRLARDGWPAARWWTRYADPQLDALVERALRDSPSMAVAATRIGGAQAALAATRSNGGGSLGLELGLNRQRYSGNGFFPAPIGGSFYNDAAVQVKAGYDFDWWGKQRALVAASLGEVNARLADAAQAETELAASVVVFTDAAFFTMDVEARRAWIDRHVAAMLAHETLTTASFTPLQVLGVPGWWPQQDAAFYANTAVFRPKRLPKE